MSDKNPLDQLLDLCLFGPIGLLVAVKNRYPELVEQGRQRLEGHAALGRFAARYAADKGKHEAGRALSKLREAQAAGVSGAAAATTPWSPEADRSTSGIAAEEVIPVRHDDDDPTTAGSVAADELAIPSYDSLAASQVVQRLDGLTADELEAVRRYEVAHRVRKTVLGKVAQLQRRA